MVTIVIAAALIGIALFILLCCVIYDEEELSSKLIHLVKLVKYCFVTLVTLVKDCLSVLFGVAVIGVIAAIIGGIVFLLIEYTLYVIALTLLAILYFGYLDGKRHDEEIRAYKHALILIKNGHYRGAKNLLCQKALDMNKSEVGGLHRPLMDYIRFMIEKYGDKEETITVYPPIRPNQLLVPDSFYQSPTLQMNNNKNK